MTIKQKNRQVIDICWASLKNKVAFGLFTLKFIEYGIGF